MALYAYGDDSGTHQDAKFCLVLGYVGSPRQWKLFRRDWQAALTMLPERGGKKLEFHAKEFFQRARWRSHESPYHRWNEAKAEVFLNRLLETIHRYHVAPIGGAANTEDFFTYSESDRRRLTGAPLVTETHWYGGEFEIIDKLVEHESSPNRPYFVVFPGFLLEAVRKSGKVGDCRVHIWLDRQPAIEARALEAFDSFKEYCRIPEIANLGPITFEESEKEVGLQAADLYAYVWNRKLAGSRMTKQLSKAFQVLTKKKPNIMVADRRYFDSLLAYLIQDQAAAINKGFARRS